MNGARKRSYNMIPEYKELHCIYEAPDTKRTAPFIYVSFRFLYNSDPSDRRLIDDILTKALSLSEKVNHSAANGINQRNHINVLADNIAGVLSEYAWQVFLNSPNDVVYPTVYHGAERQIDLQTQKGKTIEVRSSCPRNGIGFAICHSIKQFDIIGPYVNQQYKSLEYWKDYYVRALYHIHSATDIINEIKQDGFTVYLTGGATQQMMMDNRISSEKKLSPDFVQADTPSLYRVVPFSKALDSFQIKELIRSELGYSEMARYLPTVSL